MTSAQTFDLVVAGGGITGLSAAYFWLTAVDPNATVLIVEQNSRFGGPSIQHTFDVDDQRLISPGGAPELAFPSSFDPVVRTALTDLGVDIDRFYKDCDTAHYRRHGAAGLGFAFSEQIWERSHLTVHQSGGDADFTAAPVTQQARHQITALLADPTDWFAGRSDSDKHAALRARSCDQLLRDFATLDEDTHRFLRYSTSAQSGMTFDQHPALDAALIGYLGLDGLNLDVVGTPWEGLTRTGTRFFPHMDPPIFRFPDGNATIARALAHRLIPDLFKSTNVDDRLSEDIDTGALARPASQVQIHLGVDATRLHHDGSGVRLDVTLPDGTTAYHRARVAIVATPATSTARLVPELTVEQRATATALGRYPIISATVAFRNWRAWQQLGISRLSWPGHDTWQIAGLEFPVSIGAVSPSPNPDAPTTATALGSLTAARMAPADGAAAGRQRLASETARDELDHQLRRLLEEALAPAGFVAERDLAATRVEVWPNGYPRYSTSLDAPGTGNATPAAKQHLAEGVGHIAVAGVDVIDHPFLDGAMESAHRAVAHLAAKLPAR